MHYIYRVLGIVASFNHRLGQESISHLPLNAGLMVIGLLGMFLSWGELTNGRKPETLGPMLVYTAIIATCLVLVLLLFQSMIRGDLVFRRVDPGHDALPDPDLAGHSPAPEDVMRATGYFSIDHGWSRWQWTWSSFVWGTPREKWFNEVPVQFANLGTGEVAFFAYVDATVYVFGFLPQDNLAGIWAVVLRPGELIDPIRGRLYFGRRDRPAARFRFRGPYWFRRSVVISFGSEAVREAFLAGLADLVGAALAAPSKLPPRGDDLLS
jgi:hypothetical protein